MALQSSASWMHFLNLVRELSFGSFSLCLLSPPRGHDRWSFAAPVCPSAPVLQCSSLTVLHFEGPLSPILLEAGSLPSRHRDTLPHKRSFNDVFEK